MKLQQNHTGDKGKHFRVLAQVDILDKTSKVGKQNLTAGINIQNSTQQSRCSVVCQATKRTGLWWFE